MAKRLRQWTLTQMLAMLVASEVISDQHCSTAQKFQVIKQDISRHLSDKTLSRIYFLESTQKGQHCAGWS